jgi:hypothetical protein
MLFASLLRVELVVSSLCRLFLLRMVSVPFIADTLDPVDASLDRFARAVEELSSTLGARRFPLQRAPKAIDRVQRPAVLLLSLVVELAFALVGRCLPHIGGGLSAVSGPLAFVGASIPLIGAPVSFVCLPVPLVSLLFPVGPALLTRSGRLPRRGLIAHKLDCKNSSSTAQYP